jgi:hypothetical protein
MVHVPCFGWLLMFAVVQVYDSGDRVYTLLAVMAKRRES